MDVRNYGAQPSWKCIHSVFTGLNEHTQTLKQTHLNYIKFYIQHNPLHCFFCRTLSFCVLFSVCFCFSVLFSIHLLFLSSMYCLVSVSVSVSLSVSPSPHHPKVEEGIKRHTLVLAWTIFARSTAKWHTCTVLVATLIVLKSGCWEICASRASLAGYCHKYNFYHDKHMFVTCLLRQNTSFVMTKVCLSRLLSWQNLCHNKYLSWYW